MSSTLAKQGKKMAAQAASKVMDDVIHERDQVITRASKGKPKKKDDIVEDIVRGAAAAVGFVSETIKYRKAKKVMAKEQAKAAQLDAPEETPAQEAQSEFQPQNQLEHLENQPGATPRDQVHDTIWRLDDLQQDAAAQQEDTESQAPKEEPRDHATAFIARHPYRPDAALDASAHHARIACPVVLPQRRPKERGRGFVRAYAPILADVGVDQETFLDFVDTFNKVIEPNPWLYAINLAGLAGLSMPMEPMMMLLDLGVALTSAAVIEAQSRFKSNRFLDRLNEEFFAPRGLACFLATWKPDADDMVTTVNLEGGDAPSELGAKPALAEVAKSFASSSTPLSQTSLGKFQERMRAMTKQSSGTTTTADWPELAPLVFPAVAKTASNETTTESAKDEAASTHNKDKNVKKQKIKNKADRAGDWIDEYMDRTAQAKWIDENPDAPVARALPRPEFKSRYADPNHAAASGDIVAFLTGGRWQYGSEKSTKEDPMEEDDSKERVKDKKKKSASKKRDKENMTSQWLSLLKSVSDSPAPGAVDWRLPTETA